MTIVNRLLAIILVLLILAAAVGTIAIASTVLPVSKVDQVLSYPPLHQALSDLANLQPQGTQILTIVVAAVAGVLMLVLLVIELRPPHRERRYLVSQSHDGEVSIDYGTLRKVAEGAASSVIDVNEAHCSLDRRQEALRVRCHVTAAPFTEAASIGRQVEAAIRDQLQETLGKPVEHVTVRVDVAPAGTPIRVH